jgi:hypothetical protein
VNKTTKYPVTSTGKVQVAWWDVNSEACEGAATLPALTQLLSNFTPQLISQPHGLYWGSFKNELKKNHMNSVQRK